MHNPLINNIFNALWVGKKGNLGFPAVRSSHLGLRALLEPLARNMQRCKLFISWMLESRKRERKNLGSFLSLLYNKLPTYRLKHK